MKKAIYILTAGLLSVSLCAKAGNDGAKTRFRQMEGTLGKKKVSFTLMQQGDSLYGLYYEPGIYRPVYVEGNLSSDDSFHLQALDADLQAQAYMKGKVDNGLYDMKGNWEDAASIKQHPLRLKAIKTKEKIEIDIQAFHRKEGSNKPVPGSCMDVLVENIKFTSGIGPAAAGNIYKLLEQKRTEGLPEEWASSPAGFRPETMTKTFFDQHRGKMQPHPERPSESVTYYIEQAIMPRYAQNGLICLQIANSWYAGGTHMYFYKNFVTVNAQTGKETGLADLFKSGYEAKLKELAEKKFREVRQIPAGKTPGQEGFFDGGPFRMPEHFYLMPEGLGLYYNEYEIAPFNAGPTDLLIRWDELKELLVVGF